MSKGSEQAGCENGGQAPAPFHQAVRQWAAHFHRSDLFTDLSAFAGKGESQVGYHEHRFVGTNSAFM